MNARLLAACFAVVMFAAAARAGSLSNVKGPTSTGTGPYTVTFTGTTTLGATDEMAYALMLSFTDSNNKSYSSQLT